MLSNILSRDAIDSGAPNPRGTQLANLSIIFGTISTLLVIGRIITRITIAKRTGPDDYCIIVASVGDPTRPYSALNITDTAFQFMAIAMVSLFPFNWGRRPMGRRSERC